jgi:hypothetical protein
VTRPELCSGAPKEGKRSIRLLALIGAVLAFNVPTNQHRLSHRPKPHHHQHKPRFVHTDESTCYAQGTTTASGGGVYICEVANNEYPLGTRIEVSRPVFGLRVFVIDDRIGYGSQLDFYNPSEAVCDEYGREVVSFRVLSYG